MLIYVSIAKSLDISLVNVLRGKREKNMVEIDEREAIGNAITVGLQDTSLEIVKVKLEGI